MPLTAPRIVLLALAAVLASACQVRVTTDVRVDADGAGRLALVVGLDEELYAALATDDFDPFAGLDELPDGWQSAAHDDGRGIEIAVDFADGADLAARVAALSDGLGPDDPRLLEDVDLRVAADGSATFGARAGFAPPTATGIVGGAMPFDGDDLAALLAAPDQDVLDVVLRIRFPGPVEEAPGAVVDGNVATWTLAPTGLVDVTARAAVPATGVPTPVLIGAMTLVAASALVVGRTVRRRRRRWFSRGA